MEMLLAGAGILGVVALREDISKTLKNTLPPGERDYGGHSDMYPNNIGSDTSFRLYNESGQRNFPTSIADNMPVIDERLIVFNETYMPTMQDPKFISAFRHLYNETLLEITHPLLDVRFRRSPYNTFRTRTEDIGSADDQNILGWTVR